jgi:hypothetical protein
MSGVEFQMNDLDKLRTCMNNRELKKLAAKKHNEAYLESLKPKPPREYERPARGTISKAQVLLAIAPILSATVNVGTIGHCDHNT